MNRPIEIVQHLATLMYTRVKNFASYSHKEAISEIQSFYLFIYFPPTVTISMVCFVFTLVGGDGQIAGQIAGHRVDRWTGRQVDLRTDWLI